MTEKKSVGDKLNWVVTIMNTIHNVFDTIGDASQKLPPEFKQKVPGLFGISLADEQIFNGIIAQIDPGKQILIKKFLYEKCKIFERNRFINVVAGMEVIPGKPEEVEKKFDKTGQLIFEKRKAGSAGMDCRKEFLEKFADIIEQNFGGDLGKAYEFCVGGRMIIPDPLSQKTKEFFSNLNPDPPAEPYPGALGQIKKSFKKIFGR